MDIGGLTRLDSFPYRHTVAEVMAAPVVTAAPETTLAEAARLMAERGIGSLVAVDDDSRVAGILTERDVLHVLARARAGALDLTFADIMSRPVETVPQDALLHVAIARMARLKLRHLAVTDASGRLVGLVSAGAMLKLRANAALVLGDEIGAAVDARDMAAALARLPDLARGLRADEVSARGIARVISATLRDTTGRAAVLAEREMDEAGRGLPPAPYAVLVLGSAGRGESLLTPDQDNALIYDGSDGDDAWFAELGARLTRLLDEAGIPYCKGKVMASVGPWRGTVAAWRRRVEGWLARSKPEDLLNVDIFFDAVSVHGAVDLAADLRARAVAAAAGAFPFLKLLHANVAQMGSPFGLFGRIRTEAGRVDLKRHGLLPITAGARLLALASGFDGVATQDRLAAARAKGRLASHDAAALMEAHECFLGFILDQQLADLAAGLTPGNTVALDRLDRAARRRLKAAFDTVEVIVAALHDSLLGR